MMFVSLSWRVWLVLDERTMTHGTHLDKASESQDQQVSKRPSSFYSVSHSLILSHKTNIYIYLYILVLIFSTRPNWIHT